jgi:3-isopropylmalate/(R)-2-methylmalate dehydratase small subunit
MTAGGVAAGAGAAGSPAAASPAAGRIRPLRTLEGVAAPLIRDGRLADGVDTDIIIPSREMRSTGRTGLADGLFAPWRYTDAATRTPDPGFVLNQSAHAGAEILVAGANFGAGSSREHAVWALAEFGIRAILAESFSPIFANNALRNGLLPVALPRPVLEALSAWVAADPQANRPGIDLEAQMLRWADCSEPFAIHPEARAMLLAGADALDLTLAELPTIRAWQAADREVRPWVYAIATEGAHA